MRDILPNTPSKILEVALCDLIKVESMPEVYNIDMNIWLERTTKYCSVCHAGAVMACTLKATNKHVTLPHHFGENSISYKLSFINDVRTGHIYQGLLTLSSGGIITQAQRIRAKENLGLDHILFPAGEDTYRKENSSPVPESAYMYLPGHREEYRAYIECVIGVLKAIGL